MKKIVYGGIGLAAASLGLTLLMAAGSAPSVEATSSPATTAVTVYGTSNTEATPTQAQIMLGVTNQATLATTALSDNNQTMNQVIAAIEKLGVPKKDIATSGLSINPQYNQANPPAVTGYQVSDNLTVSTTVSLAGKVIDEAVADGANQINGINFTAPQTSDYQASYRAALNNAHSQAVSIASSLSEHIVGVQSVVVQSTGSVSPEPVFANATAAVNTPILPGQQENSVTLKVVYQLGQ